MKLLTLHEFIRIKGYPYIANEMGMTRQHLSRIVREGNLSRKHKMLFNAVAHQEDYMIEWEASDVQ